MNNKTEDRFYFGKPGEPESRKINDDLRRASVHISARNREGIEILETLLDAKNRGELSAGQESYLAELTKEARDIGWRPVGNKFARPGQSDKFDASSLERGSFAEASKSPMLGKLLAAKVMPDGGWRAVQAGSDTLVISFEDGDVAGNFARRVAGKGYSATSPVQAIGRYWNVEVKNG